MNSCTNYAGLVGWLEKSAPFFEQKKGRKKRVDHDLKERPEKKTGEA